MEELRKLSYIPGGDIILRDYLIIENEEAVAELLGEVEPEYNYTEAEVEYLLEKGTLDKLKDALDFAPSGVIDLIKDIAVKTELNDINKRDAIFKKTGFNVTNAVNFNKEIAGTEARTLLGLKSTNFTFKIDGNNVIFSVVGYGHGVGMSQTGADSLAKSGSNYEEIIKHFYTNVEIIEVNSL